MAVVILRYFTESSIYDSQPTTLNKLKLKP